jgi:hypothetical protein
MSAQTAQTDVQSYCCDQLREEDSSAVVRGVLQHLIFYSFGLVPELVTAHSCSLHPCTMNHACHYHYNSSCNSSQCYMMMHVRSETCCLPALTLHAYILTAVYTVHAITDAQTDTCHHRDGMKRTPLMLASRYGNLSTVLTLLHEGAHRYRCTLQHTNICNYF